MPFPGSTGESEQKMRENEPPKKKAYFGPPVKHESGATFGRKGVSTESSAKLEEKIAENNRRIEEISSYISSGVGSEKVTGRGGDGDELEKLRSENAALEAQKEQQDKNTE